MISVLNRQPDLSVPLTQILLSTVIHFLHSQFLDFLEDDPVLQWVGNGK